MKLGRILGKVWASAKDKKLDGIHLYIMQPVDENDAPLGRALVATDTVGSHEGDLVYWVGGAEACFALEGRLFPSDASIVGIVDRKSIG